MQVEQHGEDEVPSFSDVCQRAVWLMSALRCHQAVETDLMFESRSTHIGVSDWGGPGARLRPCP